MSSATRMRTGRQATDDMDSSIGTATETTMAPLAVGYSDSARGMRLRLRFDSESWWWRNVPRASPLDGPTRMTS